jgi:hypothetical protein
LGGLILQPEPFPCAIMSSIGKVLLDANRIER